MLHIWLYFCYFLVSYFFTSLFWHVCMCNELFVTKFAVAQYFLSKDVKQFKEDLKAIKASYTSASMLL